MLFNKHHLKGDNHYVFLHCFLSYDFFAYRYYHLYHGYVKMYYDTMSLFSDLNKPVSFVYKDNVFIVNNKYRVMQGSRIENSSHYLMCVNFLSYNFYSYGLSNRAHLAKLSYRDPYFRYNESIVQSLFFNLFGI